MTTLEKQSILYLIQKKINKEDFLSSIFPVPVSDYLRDGLKKSLQQEDAESVDYLLMLGAVFDFSDETVRVLCKLLLEGWHREQEEIARLMQQRFSNSVCIDAITIAMQSHYDHMPTDDPRFPFVIKCAYALADSGKAEGIEKLKEMARAGDEVVRLSAQWQLDRLAGKNPEPLIW